MNNFIEDLDEKYQKERKLYRIEGKTEFGCNIPFKVELYGNTNKNYIIRKKEVTKFLYTKNGCRVYFTDADILTMLLQIESKGTIDILVENLKKAYQNYVEKYYIYIGEEKYEVEGIFQVEDDQILNNPQDIDISFNELIVLVNLILSKDRASSPLGKGDRDFFKETLSKYISLIQYYYYKEEKAKMYLLDLGYDIGKDIYSNYNTPYKQKKKTKLFANFEVFERSGVL